MAVQIVTGQILGFGNEQEMGRFQVPGSLARLGCRGQQMGCRDFQKLAAKAKRLPARLWLELQSKPGVD
jgi:hypothetical protein